MADGYFQIKCLVAAQLQVSALHGICAVRLDKADFMKILAKSKSETEGKKHCPIQKFHKQIYVATCYRYIICILHVREAIYQRFGTQKTTPDRLL